MRTIQEVFDAVIATGVYDTKYRVVQVGTQAATTIAYMCNCLRRACAGGVITPLERNSASDAIRDYAVGVGGDRASSVLFLVLRDNGLTSKALRSASMKGSPKAFEYMLGIYKDWDNRPMPKPKQRTLQEVFDFVISEGIYSNNGGDYSYQFMCHALRSANRRKLISDREYVAALASVEKYMRKLLPGRGKYTYCTLLDVLVLHKLMPADVKGFRVKDNDVFQFLTSVYSNWAKRPQPKKVKANGNQ